MAEYCNDNFQMYEDNQDRFQFFQALVGPYFTPSISEDGTITWTNNGNLPNPDPVNVRGPIGVGIDEIRQNPDYTMTIYYTDGSTWTTPVPVRGQIGPTPDFSIGTVTTGAPGSDASATITGTEEEPVLNLTIPQGAPGEVTAASMAPVYSTSATYAVGDYVVYNGQLYRCTTAIETAEAWTSEHWASDAIAPEVGELKNATNDLALSKAPVITDTASGAIASFPDGADGLPLKKLVAQITPVQDLHGQDAPYPPGGGKNLIPTKLYSGGSYNVNIGTVFNFTESAKQFTDEGNGVFSINTTATWEGYTMLAPIGDATNVCFKTVLNSTGQDGFAAYLLDASYAVLEKVIGNSAPVTCLWPINLTNYPTAKYFAFFFTNRGTASTKLTVTEPQLELGSTATAYAPYSNECPISGWTGLEGKRTGKNLLKLRDDVTTITHAGITYTINSDGTITASGTASGNSYFYFKPTASTFWDDAPDGEYILSGCPSGGTLTTYYVQVQNPGWENDYGDGVAITKNGNNVKGLGIAIKSGVTVSNLVFKPMIRLASDTDSTYAQYTPETLSVSWQDTAGTVYGGSLVVNEDGSGVLTAIYADVDLTTGMSGGTAGSGCVFFKALTNAKTVPNSQIAPIIAEAYKPVRYNAIASSPYMIAIRDNGTVYVNTGSADVQPVGKAIYELATPLTYTFTDLTQLSTILGTNNVWVDTGDTSVEYRADTKLYIDKKIAEIVNS